MNLVPTASTTAALALGDALAMTLLVRKGFREEDFASLHPGRQAGQAADARRERDAQNFPSSAGKGQQNTPSTWNGYLNMTGVNALANLKRNR